MSTKIIQNEEEYDQALARAEQIFGAQPGSPEGDELALLLLVIKDYEQRHHPVPPPDPIEAIKFQKPPTEPAGGAPSCDASAAKYNPAPVAYADTSSESAPPAD